MALSLRDRITRLKALSGREIEKVTQKSDGAVLWTAYEDGTVERFYFTGGIQEFTVPVKGVYQLEVYGAQGGRCGNGTGTLSGSGGNGGYSKGNANLKAGDKLYIGVGGQGKNAASFPSETANIDGGYNGGGAGQEKVDGSSWRKSYYCNASGGGATHIATENGTLKELSEKENSVLIVAGGGGGGGHVGGIEFNNANFYYDAGEGGGNMGGDSRSTSSGAGKGATQTTGYAFGQGGSLGGGGGYYGGFGASDYNGGGGGSGYIGGVEEGITEGGKNTGDGWAAITFLRQLTGVLYENGALTELGEKYITELETSKTFRPAANTGYASTGFYPIKLNEHLDLKITWDIVLGIAGGMGDVFGITLNGKQEYSYTDNGTASYLSTGIETISENVNEVLALLTCSNKGTSDTSYIKVTINKIEVI